MENKKAIIVSGILLVLSGILLSLATIYYDFISKVEEYRYSDNVEFTRVKEGIDFINKLPIQFNITNQYFSGFDNLDEENREQILMSYILKNHMETYNCGVSGLSVCVDKEKLSSNTLLDIFDSSTKFLSNSIKIYLDDYGTYRVNTTENSPYYRVDLEKDNQKYRKYSVFSHYKEENDNFIFYMYEGYYTGNCTKGDSLELHDFISGEVVYSDTCNGNQDFTVDPSDNIKKLQLYKYELKKDENDKYYLYGYNPVNSKK